MSWTYDATNLDPETSSGRLNVVRLLVGDTNTSDQLLQDEEITYFLGSSSDKVYFSASMASSSIASKFASLVDVEIDGVLKEDYSKLSDKYSSLSYQLKQEGLRMDGSNISVYAGGLGTLSNPSRLFTTGQYDNR